MKHFGAKKMTHCAECGVHLTTVTFRCTDANVCSQSCASRRMLTIKRFDPNLVSPPLWQYYSFQQKYSRVVMNAEKKNFNRDVGINLDILPIRTNKKLRTELPISPPHTYNVMLSILINRATVLIAFTITILFGVNSYKLFKR